MYPREIYQLEEGINSSDYIVATYYVEAERQVNILKKAAAAAIEQSTGTWVDVPAETPELREKHSAKVLGIYEVPDYEFELPESVRERRYIVELAFPIINFGTNLPLMLSALIGNISSTGKIKLIDIRMPKEFINQFPGPRFGIEKIRQILDIDTRPLLNNMIKPCTGFSPEVGAKLAYDVAAGGVDIIKDDELLGDMPFSKIEDRVTAYMAAIDKANDEKGEKTLYTVNITDRVDKIIENADRAVSAGANALMINYMTVGISGLQALAEDASANVPILAHLDFAGAIYESPYSGMSSWLVMGKLPRLVGADIVVCPSPYGKFPFLEERYMQIWRALTKKYAEKRRTFPMPAAGVYPGMVPQLLSDMGTDCVIGAGGAIHGHPMGPVAGAKAFRQAIDCFMENISLDKIPSEYKELSAAIEKWGIFSKERAKKLYEL